MKISALTAPILAWVFIAMFSLVASLALVPTLANAQTCTSAGASCNGGTGSCDYDEEGRLFCYVAPAGAGTNNQYLLFYKNTIVGTINGVLVPILIAIAFIVFLWGVFKYYIWGAEDESSRKSGHQLILWGVIGFVVIVSLWGIVNIVTNILIPTAARNTAPAFPTL